MFFFYWCCVHSENIAPLCRNWHFLCIYNCNAHCQTDCIVDNVVRFIIATWFYSRHHNFMFHCSLTGIFSDLASETNLLLVVACNIHFCHVTVIVHFCVLSAILNRHNHSINSLTCVSFAILNCQGQFSHLCLVGNPQQPESIFSPGKIAQIYLFCVDVLYDTSQYFNIFSLMWLSRT